MSRLRDTQRACEALDWLVVESRAGAGWGAHLLFRGVGDWACVNYRDAPCERAGADQLVAASIRVVSEDRARARFAAAPDVPVDRMPPIATRGRGSLATFEGKLFADYRGDVVAWEIATRTPVVCRPTDAIWRDEDPVFDLAIDPRTRCIATGDGIREFALWSVDRLDKLRVFTGHQEEVCGVVFLDA